MRFALSGARIFDGENFVEGHSVLVDGPRISAVVGDTDIPNGTEIRKLAGGLLAPGFIDVQVNGGGGSLLNLNPSVECVRTIADSHRRFGTTGMLPTVITDTAQTISKAIDAVREARASGLANVLGIHIEGPFLDPVRKGAHDPDLIRSIGESDIFQIKNAGCGGVMLTLAPNKVAPSDIRKLVQAGTLVSLGHSDASYDEVLAALDAGATGFTHLFNAMSQLSGREPGMVGAALTDPRAFIGLIADGFHVHVATARLAVAAASHDRFMLVSDAMPPAAGGPDVFELQGRPVRRREGRLQLEDGTLAGSNLTMDEAVRFAVRELGLPLKSALQMASTNPARFLGREDLGRLKPGFLASMVHLDDSLAVAATWVEGQ